MLLSKKASPIRTYLRVVPKMMAFMEENRGITLISNVSSADGTAFLWSEFNRGISVNSLRNCTAAFRVVMFLRTENYSSAWATNTLKAMRNEGSHEPVQRRPTSYEHIRNHIGKMSTLCRKNVNEADILILQWGGFLRGTEVVDLRIKDLRMVEDPRDRHKTLILTLRNSKTRARNSPTQVPIELRDNWRRAVITTAMRFLTRGDGDAPLFIMPSGRKMNSADVGKIHKQLAIERGENPAEFGSHSGRVGAAIDFANAGVDHVVIASLGRWKSVDSVKRYIKRAELLVDAATTRVDNHRGSRRNHQEPH